MLKAMLISSKMDYFFIKNVKVVRADRSFEAKCKQTAEGFVVLKGSQIELIDSESIPPGIIKARQKARGM